MADHAAKQPEPVLTRAAIVTVISVLVALLVKVGAGDVSTWLEQNEDVIAGAVLAVGPIVAGWLARRHVTPTVAGSPAGTDGDTSDLPAVDGDPVDVPDSVDDLPVAT